MEQAVVDYAAGVSKSIVSFIAGRASPPGKKMGHAGAIVADTLGSYDGKRYAPEATGVAVADTPAEIPVLLGGGLDDSLSQSAAYAVSV